MSLNKAVITPAESDVFLAHKADWLILDDTVKLIHLARSSVYLQTNWTCAEIDWDDELTISDVVKESCAYYAYADFVGNLFSSLSADGTAIGRLTQKTENLGDLESTYKYSDTSSSTSSDPLDYPDTLMATECTSVSSGSQTLTRV
jgi:hypothetical protein